MTIRMLFRVDSIDSNERHVGYGNDEEGKVDRSKILRAQTATVSLTPVDPGSDKDHPNFAHWGPNAQGRVLLNHVLPEVAEQLATGHEYFVDIAPVS